MKQKSKLVIIMAAGGQWAPEVRKLNILTATQVY
jgi:hypothetical protein